MAIDGLKDDLQDFRDDLDDYIEEDLRESADRALEAVVRKEIFAKAIYWTPVELGNLQGTAHVVSLGPLQYQIVYPMDYAIYVHEDTEASHDGHEQAKFLSRAFQWVRTFRGGIAGAVASRMD